MYYHQYAIKFIDENGFTCGYGQIETMNSYARGEIVTDSFGNQFKIDFEY